MKEIKVATLTKEEVKELEELYKMKGKIETLIAQTSSANAAFWKNIVLEHNLSPGNLYILGNSICRQDIE